MDIDYFKRRLLQKERELLSNAGRLQDEARSAGDEEVRDSADSAAESEATAESLQEESVAGETLVQVRDALRRIADGTYGKCVSCGRPLEAARLEAVPWAAYCVEDQEKRDRAAHVLQGGSTL